MVIFAASADLSKTRREIHRHCAIAVAHYEVSAAHPMPTRLLDHVVQKQPSHSPSLMRGVDGDQEQFRLVGNASSERKTDGLARAAIISKAQRHAGHRQDAGALGEGPGLAV